MNMKQHFAILLLSGLLTHTVTLPHIGFWRTRGSAPVHHGYHGYGWGHHVGRDIGIGLGTAAVVGTAAALADRPSYDGYYASDDAYYASREAARADEVDDLQEENSKLRKELRKEKLAKDHDRAMSDHDKA